VSGYTPLFGSLTTGTLCGRWPDIGLWPIVLSLSDRHGIVDVTPAYLAGVTGLALEDVIACMKRFCEPDPGSRSSEAGGARLVLLDPRRDWGWKIVNHGIYRERARLMQREIERVTSGENRERMASRKGQTPAHPRSPPTTPADPPSDSDSDSDSEKNSVRASPADPPPGNPAEPPITQPAQSPSIDAAIFAEARQIFGSSIGGQLNRAIRAKGKPWVIDVIERCRGKDPEAARAYLAAALKGREERSDRFRTA
jgi:hypothetical protein